MPPAPVKIDAELTSAWTGRELVVYGATGVAADGNFLHAVPVAEAYDPATRTWRRLPRVPGPVEAVGDPQAFWTGRTLVVTSAFATLTYDPRANAWRRLPRGHGGLRVWTGHELLAWGGGCCGDAFSDGAAYDPATGRWRRLPPSPLAGSQHPLGAWTGRELVVLVGGFDPDGKPWPARLARAAAYDPATNRWRRIAAAPSYRADASAVWDGREVLLIGGSRAAFAYDPVDDRWRRLAPMPSAGPATAIWTGKRVLVWRRSGGFSYDPRADSWAKLPRAPRPGAAVAWTGGKLLVWDGARGAALAP
jgi:hypothetical protein